MPLEFALRPRFRLDERVPVRRRRELPAYALPVAAYWLGTAALTYRLVYAAPDEAAREPSVESAVNRTFVAPAPEPAPEPPSTDLQARVEPAPASAPLDRERFASLEHEEREPAPPPPPEPASMRVATNVAVPREPSSPRPSRAEPETPFVAPALTARPRPEPAPEPHRWLFGPPADTAHHEPPASSARPEPRDELRDTGGTLPGCEAIAASANQELDLRGGSRAPDLPREAFAGVLDDGAYLSACGVPERTTLDICVAVQEGKVRGVTVVTRPANSRLAACVRRAVARLRFPASPRLDIARTRFDAAR